MCEILWHKGSKLSMTDIMKSLEGFFFISSMFGDKIIFKEIIEPISLHKNIPYCLWQISAKHINHGRTFWNSKYQRVSRNPSFPTWQMASLTKVWAKFSPWEYIEKLMSRDWLSKPLFKFQNLTILYFLVLLYSLKGMPKILRESFRFYL